jgi:hypothetical protein
MNDSPVREYKQIIDDSGHPGYVNRLLIATPTTGLVRIEWVAARYGQVIPVNWSMVSMNQYMNGYITVRYQVDDAQNLIVRQALLGDFEWLLLVEHDNVLPPHALMEFNEWMRRADTPVVSGLYYTRSQPSEPLVFRGRGNSTYRDWQIGDHVWCDGVPTGCVLINVRLLRAMWDESAEYLVGNELTRRVFETPRHTWASPDTEEYITRSGTSDLAWCDRIMQEGFFKKSGWDDYEGKDNPFIVDTNILVGHIEQDGRMFPPFLGELQNELRQKQDTKTNGATV